MKKEDNKKMKDTTLVDILCRWYAGAIIGFVIGRSIGGSLTGLVGFAIGAFAGELLRKNLHKEK